MFPIIYDFGWFSLKSYGLMLAIAFFTGIYLARRQAKRVNLNPGHIDLLSIGIIIFSILGARLFHAISVSPGYYFHHPLQIFNITNGGLVFYGGLIFATTFALIYCKLLKINFLKIADIFSPSIAVGLVFSRIGCFLAGCCYGKQCNLPWAVSIFDSYGITRLETSVHPTQIYSAFNGLLIFIILIVLRRFKRFEGQLFLTLLIIYSVTRPIIEIFRADHRGNIGPFSTSQIISIPVLIIAVYIFVIKFKAISETKN